MRFKDAKLQEMEDAKAEEDRLSRTVVHRLSASQSGEPRFSAPSHDECKAFKAALQRRRLFVKIREAKGAEKILQLHYDAVTGIMGALENISA